MARYFVGSGTNWSSTSSWATSSGGASGAAVPTSSDDVFLDANSPGNLTIDVAASCQSITCTGFTHTLTHTAAITLSVGSSTAGASNVALLFVSGMTYTLGSTTTSTISFVSTSATQQSITTGGKTMGSIIFNGIGGTWQLQDNFTTTQVANCALTLTNGSLDTNSKTITTGGVLSNNTNSGRTLSLGASAISIASNGGTTGWVMNSTGLTFNAGTSAITLSTSNQSTVFGSSLTYNNVTINYGNGSGDISGTGTTFNTLILEGGNQARLRIANNFTTTNLTIQSTVPNSTNVPICQSNIAGTQRTITVTNTPTIQFVIFKDIAISGPGVPYTTTRTGDAGNNGGMTLSSARTLYWVNNGATSYASTSTWSLSSGGASGQDPPMPQDTIVIDANSITSAGKTMNISWQGIPTLDFTNVANSPAVNFQNTNGFTTFFGDVILNSSMTASGAGSITFANSATDQHLDTKGISMAQVISGIDKPSSALRLLSDYVSTSATSLTLNTNISSTSIGTFDANGHNVTVSAVNSSNSTTRSITMGSGTWTLTGTGTVWQFSTMTNLTFNAGTSTIAVTDTSASSKTIAHGGSMTLNNLTITGGGTGAIIFGANGLTLNNFTVSNSPTSLTFTSGAGSATTINGTFNVTGTAGNLVTITASTAGTQALLSKSSGIVSCDYLSLKDSKATGGAAWYAGANSTNVSNNTGWAFYAPSSTSTIGFFQLAR